jgi:GT2 family glycosyltransferase
MTAPRRPFAAGLRNEIVARIVPRPAHRHALLSRVFLRTSGAPRGWLPEAWKAAIMQRLVINWLIDRQGIAVSDGRVAIGPPWDADAEVCPEVVFWQNPATGVLLLRERGAAVIAGGEARLNATLDEHPEAVVAYGDAIYTDAEGRVSGHWLKAPRTDPLLVAQGLLLHGVVAIAKDAPGTPKLLDALRGGSTLQAAMAAFAADLPAASCVHCAAPVVVCTPPVPLPVDQPALHAPLPVVSVLIPTRNGWDVLGPCLASLRDTDWPRDRLEIVVVNNGSNDPETLRELEALRAKREITLLCDNGDFNFSRLNNDAVRAARGELLVLLNNDTTARDPGWLRTLAAYARQPDVGAVGCKLLYPDGDVQHAGVALGLRGGAQHVFVGLRADDPGYNHLAAVDRSVSAVTAACLAVTRHAFDTIGGLRKEFAVSYNDVVFCADLVTAGYRNICVADPLFVHHESRSRGKDTNRGKKDRHRAERAQARALHPALFAQDPYYSAHLSRKVEYRLLTV